MNKITVRINKVKWLIEFISADDARLEDSRGITHNVHRIIYIDKTLKEPDITNTLTHELSHAFMWEYGFYQVEFNHETVCDFIGIYARHIVEMTKFIINKLNDGTH